MTILAHRGSGTPVTSNTTWANTTNAVDGTPGTNPATYVTWVNAVNGAVGYIEISGYNFAAIDDAATVNSVTVSVRHLVGVVARYTSVQFQAYSGATPLGTLATGTLSITAHNDTATFPVTVAQLKAANFKVRAICTRGPNTNSATYSLDYVDVTVDYTVATNETWSGGSTGSIGVAATSGTFVGALADIHGRSLEVVQARNLESAVARVLESAPVSGTPQTWDGSTGQIGVAGQTGSFVGGAITWAGGSTGQIGVAGQTGSFILTGGGAQTWDGSTATIGIAGQPGNFAAGAATWAGSTATIGVAGQTGTITQQVFDRVLESTQARNLESATARLLEQSPVTATPQIWTGSPATIGVFAAAGSFGGSGSFPQTWSGTTATIGVTGITGKMTQPMPAIGEWDDDDVIGLMFGDKDVTEWLMLT